MILARAVRVVSLIASSTEIVAALGLRQSLVGISHECDYPSDVKALPVCTSPKFVPDGSSYEIDQKVKAILQESLSVYKVDAKLLEELQPTHIITQSQCEVCAVSLRDVQEAACDLITSRPQIISLEPNCLRDIWADILKVGTALGVRQFAESLIAQLKARLKTLSLAVQSPAAAMAASDLNGASGESGSKCDALVSERHRPTMLFVEWIDPLMTGGNWMPEIIEIAGGKNLFGVAGKHSPPLQWNDVLEHDPEVIVVAPCGFDIERTMEDMHVLAEKPGWGNLRAVKTKNVFVADGNQYFNRPGPRIVDSAEILADIMHPRVLNHNHYGKGWVEFSC